MEPSARSLNSGGCFLLVTPELCFLWTGEFANQQERAKVTPSVLYLKFQIVLIPDSDDALARQAGEVTSTILRRRDLGCRASEVVRLEEGLNCDGSLADDFWSLLGGRTHYRGERSTSDVVDGTLRGRPQA